MTEILTHPISFLESDFEFVGISLKSLHKYYSTEYKTVILFFHVMGICFISKLSGP